MPVQKYPALFCLKTYSGRKVVHADKLATRGSMHIHWSLVPEGLTLICFRGFKAFTLRIDQPEVTMHMSLVVHAN